MPVPLSPMKMTVSRSVIQEPFGERGDRGLRDVRVVGEDELLEAFDLREARVDQAPSFAAFGAFGHLGLKQRAEVGGRRLLLARGFGGERAEAATDGRELELDRVRLDQRFQRGGLRAACCVVLIVRLRAAGRSR